MNNKIADCEPFDNVRKLVKFLNKKNIPKEDIVEILNINGQVLLVYYHPLEVEEL